MEILFEGLTKSEIEYLKYLEEHGYYDGFEMFCNKDTSTDYRVQKLEQNGYITLNDTGPYPGTSFVTITGKGVAALVDYDKYKVRIEPLYSQIDSLKRIAESSEKQAQIAEESAASASRESRISKRLAIASIIIAALVGVIDFIAAALF